MRWANKKCEAALSELPWQSWPSKTACQTSGSHQRIVRQSSDTCKIVRFVFHWEAYRTEEFSFLLFLLLTFIWNLFNRIWRNKHLVCQKIMEKSNMTPVKYSCCKNRRISFVMSSFQRGKPKLFTWAAYIKKITGFKVEQLLVHVHPCHAMHNATFWSYFVWWKLSRNIADPNSSCITMNLDHS